MSDSTDTPTGDDKFPPGHHWQTHEGGWVTCVECEAHSSWCDYPPLKPAPPPGAGHLD